jgi:phage terminase Nu1 subunit (DNA packaging protein)
MTVLSRTEYAAIKGWSRQYVGKLAKQGRLIYTSDGKVDVEATDQYLEMTGDPARSNAGTRIAPVITSSVEHFKIAPAVPSAISQAAPDYHKAKTRLAIAQAARAETDLQKVTGELVDREVVDEAAFVSGRMTRDLLLSLPPKLAPVLSAMTSTWDIEKHLLSEIRQALEEAERLSNEDFDHALTLGN